jgi:hypothetical protein
MRTYVRLGLLLAVVALAGGGLSTYGWSASSAPPASSEDVHFTGTVIDVDQGQHFWFWEVEVLAQLSGPPITEATVYVYQKDSFHDEYYYSWLCEGSLEVDLSFYAVGLRVEVLGIYEPSSNVYPCEVGHFMRETEACCFADDTCMNLDDATCTGDGGTPQGPGTDCSGVDCAAAPTPPPSPSPSPEATPTPEPTPTSTPTPSPTPSPTATATATPSATRTVVWGPGWHNGTWSGASTPEEAFACADGSYAAAYRLVSGGWERHFPDRPEISNMADLEPYDAFLILVTGDVTCQIATADHDDGERTLEWGVGWQNDGWSGADGSEPEDAFECVEGSYAAAYRLVSGGWERYFPDRPDVSNMGPLDEYDAFLILVTEPVSCSMAIAP